MKLGTGGEGPWENCWQAVERASARNPHRVAAHRNRDFHVQRFAYPQTVGPIPAGVEVLTVGRQDESDNHPGWRVLQSIKNRLAPNGTERYGVEMFPPAQLVVDNAHLWHIWVMPLGWEPGFGLHLERLSLGGIRI